MGKHTLFKWPFGGLMRWLGGVSIDRTKNNNAVAQMVDWFGTEERLVLVIPPSGTRSATVKWKTGFYHIAVGAGVPLALCFIDYRRRVIGMAQVFHPTGNFEADLAAIEAIYAPISEWTKT
jgi:1-acyl-sn-glycerol-3-phosphate acyltransferase